jgi:hypothetical protein
VGWIRGFGGCYVFEFESLDELEEVEEEFLD